MEASRAKKLRPGEEVPEEGAHSASGARAEDAPAAGGPSSSAISAVFLQLLPRIATSMAPNEVACVLRLLCKAAAAALRGPQHATVHLSEPVPPAEFKWRWCGPQSLRSTTHEQRQQLEKLTARSGVVANLEALEARGDLPLLSSPAAHWDPLLDAAAGAGRLELCRCLHEQRGVPLRDSSSLGAAAAGGHADVCEWLLDRGCKWYRDPPCTALMHGHVRLAERLLQLWPQGASFTEATAVELVKAAARGCDLATLQRLHAEHVASRGVDLTGWQGGWQGLECLGAAARSPTPDWAAKVEWLAGLGCPRNSIRACAAVAYCKDAAARLAWLHARGYPLVNAGCTDAAIYTGNAEVLRYVLAQGVRIAPHNLPHLLRGACISGSLETLQVLWDVGGRPGADALEAAAERGHLHIVSWAAEQLGERAVLSAGLFRAAAESGSLPLLRWLHERGCPWDPETIRAAAAAGSKQAVEWLHERGCPWGATVFVAAAWAGSEELLEWLAERGCPLGVGGAAYVEAAAQLDMPTLRCLARLGCPFAPHGGTFKSAAWCVGSRVGWKLPLDPRPLQWLLDTGCPVDWEDAMRLPFEFIVQAGLREWLAAQRQQRA